MRYKSIETLIREANKDPKEDKYTRLQHDIYTAIGLFDTFGYREQRYGYTNYEEGTYLYRICKKIAKKFYKYIFCVRLAMIAQSFVVCIKISAKIFFYYIDIFFESHILYILYRKWAFSVRFSA